jgi:hypothetical protein
LASGRQQRSRDLFFVLPKTIRIKGELSRECGTPAEVNPAVISGLPIAG